MVSFLELFGMIPAMENHLSLSWMTESQRPYVILGLEEWKTAPVFHVLSVGTAQICTITAYFAEPSRNLV